MVPGDHPVVEAEDHVGQGEIVVPRSEEGAPAPRRSRSRCSPRRRPGTEADPGSVVRPHLRQEPARHAQRVACRRAPDPGLEHFGPRFPCCARRQRGPPRERSSDSARGSSGMPLPADALSRNSSQGRSRNRAATSAGSPGSSSGSTSGGALAHSAPPRRPAVSSRPGRVRRAVSFTCSDFTSSGGVRYPQASAPSWR